MRYKEKQPFLWLDTYHSPWRLLLIVALSIFLAEALIMSIINSFHHTEKSEIIFDSAALVLLLSPILYYFFFRPLLLQIRDRDLAEEALKDERDKLRRIMDSMPDGVYIVNQACDIEYVNPVLEREFGPVGDRKCFEYFHDRTEICPWCRNEEVFAGKSVQWEWHSYKTGRTYDLFDTPITNEDGSVSKLEFFHDITARKKAEEELTKSEEKYRLLVETMNEGLGVVDEKGMFTYANKKLCEMLGYSPEEMVGRSITDFFEGVNRSIIEEQFERRRRGESGVYEIAWSRRDGSLLFARVSPRPVFDKDGRFRGGFAIITDITEIKRAEDSLREYSNRLQFLSSQLMIGQEQERRRIAKELHDEMGQAMNVMKLQVRFIRKGLRPEQSVISEECDSVIQHIDQVTENIRLISRELTPSVLEDFGLTSAIRSMTDNFGKYCDTKVKLDIVDADNLLSRDKSIVIYRVIQEALTNIVKHAVARHVSVTVRRENHSVSFVVEDDGKGFDVEQARHRDVTERGLGLTIMAERVKMIGGSIDISSRAGKGTRVAFSVPVEGKTG